MPTFDDAISGIQARFGALTSTSPFTANPLGGANPFGGGSPFMASNPFGSSPFGQGGSPFGQSPFGQGGSPFGNNPFGGGSPFTANPFGGGNPFGSNPFGGSFNPYSPFAHENDPLGTGLGERPESKATPGSGPTGSGVNFSGPATADDNKGLTGESIDAYIARTRPNSPLKGAGNHILAEANRQGVSVPMLLGIMLLESEFGTTGALPQHFNYGGLTGSGWNGQTGSTSGMARAFATFSTREHGISALIANLASGLYKGKSIQQQIATWYLGDPNANINATDEHGNATVAQYLATVGKVYSDLGLGYDPKATPTQVTSSMGRGNGAWEQVARSFTREGGDWVDYTNAGIRITGNPKDGFDCSSFVGYVMGLDRNIWNAQAQADAARQRGTFSTDFNTLQKGSIIFMQGTNPNDPSARPVSHVGIYLGNGKMIHTGTPGRGVEIVDIAGYMKYWYGHGTI